MATSAQRGELLREAVDQPAAADVGLLMHALEHAVVQAGEQQVELRAELGDGAVLALAVVERRR